ncbi:unnamed protein product [Mytilus coruscus]|uniref:Retrotransposon gag domain-containing protein n=1 Tax=Mytilus coruscus TaxID=42192 RepID=A0A6J8BEI0_MYTCO|nr:unnamed protein product [Mytilus coruscus]
MQSQYKNYGNGEQQPYRWNQQNFSFYPDTRFNDTAYQMQNRTESYIITGICDEFISKSRLPYFNGKGDWKTFMVQFQIIAEHNNWSQRQQTVEMLLVLKDEALTFVTELAPEVRTSFMLFNSEMERRFGNYNFPETYRRELQTVKKEYKESIHEYAARIEGMLETTEDEQEVDYEDLNCRKAGHQRYVTEERLNQFGRDMRESMTKDIVKSIGDMMDEKLMNKEPERRENKWLPKEKYQKLRINAIQATKKGISAGTAQIRRMISNKAGTVGQVSALEMSNVNAESADFHLAASEIRIKDDEDAESADFNFDLHFGESEIQIGSKEKLQKI